MEKGLWVVAGSLIGLFSIIPVLQAELRVVDIPLAMEADGRSLAVDAKVQVPVLIINRSLSDLLDDPLQEPDDAALMAVFRNLRDKNYGALVAGLSQIGFTVTDDKRFGEELRRLYFSENVSWVLLAQISAAGDDLSYLFRGVKGDFVHHTMLMVSREGLQWKGVISHDMMMLNILSKSVTTTGFDVVSSASIPGEDWNPMLLEAIEQQKLGEWLLRGGGRSVLREKVEELVLRMRESSMEAGFTPEKSRDRVLQGMRSGDEAQRERYIREYTEGVATYPYALHLPPFYILRGGDPRVPWVFLLDEPGQEIRVTNVGVHGFWYQFLEQHRSRLDTLARYFG